MKAVQVCGLLGAFLSMSTAWWDKNIGEPDPATDPALVYHSYARIPYCSPSNQIAHPETTHDLQQIVLEALAAHKTLKPLGGRHTRNDAICTDGTPVAMDHFNSMELNSDHTVTVGAGTRTRALLLFLQENNRTLINLPKFTGITVGGAIGTGAHGSSLRHFSTLGDQAVSMTVVNGVGQVKIIKDEDLKEWRVNLGLLGFIVQVTLKTVPLFKIRITRTREPDSVLSDGSLAERARNTDSFGVQWYPNQGVVGVTENVYVDVNTPGDCFETLVAESTPESAGGTKALLDTLQERRAWNAHFALEQMNSFSFDRQVFGLVPVISDDGLHFKNPGVGISWRMIAGQCFSCYWDMGPNSYYTEDDEVAIDLDELPAAVETIKAIAAKVRFPLVTVGVAMRFIKQSDAYISFTNGWNETVVLEIIPPARIDQFNTPKFGLAAYQAIIQALLKKHNGRPHWGKNGLQYVSSDVLRRRVPGRLKFLAAMAKNDPSGVFMNKFGRRLAGLSTHMDIHPNMTHCALENYCICDKDSDCADGQVCSNLNDGKEKYPVCKDNATFPDPPLDPYDPLNSTSVIQAILKSISS